LRVRQSLHTGSSLSALLAGQSVLHSNFMTLMGKIREYAEVIGHSGCNCPIPGFWRSKAGIGSRRTRVAPLQASRSEKTASEVAKPHFSQGVRNKLKNRIRFNLAAYLLWK
jgi:hypothetical protein